MSKFILCKTDQCKRWNECGSNYCKAGKKVVETTPKGKTFLCKNFEAIE
jgi:hypothetical protein